MDEQISRISTRFLILSRIDAGLKQKGGIHDCVIDGCKAAYEACKLKK